MTITTVISFVLTTFSVFIVYHMLEYANQNKVLKLFSQCKKKKNVDHLNRYKTIKRLDFSGIPFGFMDHLAFSKYLPNLRSLNFESSGRLTMDFLGAYYVNSNGDSFNNLVDINLSYSRINNYFLENVKKNPALINLLTSDINNYKALNITELKVRGIALPSSRLRVDIQEDNIRICLVIVVIDISLNIPTACVANLNKLNSRPTLRLVDMSDNGIETVDVSVYPYLQQARFINCSYNRLTTISFITGAIDNNTKSAQLEQIHCSNNLIMTIPTTIGKLWPNITSINVSHNMLQTIPSDLTELMYLRTIDVSYNRIFFLEAHITNTFHQFHTDVIKDHCLKLKIDVNLFECDCTDDSLNFIRWIQNSEVISNPNGNIRRCSFEDTILEIDELVLDKVAFRCNIPKLIAVVGCSSLLFIAIVLVVCWRVRRYRKQIELRKTIEKYKREDKFKFAVFLSYAGIDAEVVMNNILNTMDMHLRNLLGTDKQCVATGDYNFRPGFSVPEEIIRCIDESAVVVFCISKEFCKSRWCEHEVFIACYDKKPIVLMYLEQVDKHELPKLLTKPFQKTKTSKWVLNKKEELEIIPKWDKVCHSIVGLIPLTQIILDLKVN